MDDVFDLFAHKRSFVRSKHHPSGLTTAMRLKPPPDAADGYEDGFIASPECFITVKRIDVNRTFVDEERGLGRLAFLFYLGGQRIVEFAGFGQRRLNGPSFYVYHFPPGVRKRNTWSQGDYERVVAVSFWTDRLPEIVEDVLGPNEMMSALRARTDQYPILLQRPLTLEMEQAARHVLLPSIHASLLPHLLIAKANELLCLGLDSVLLSLTSTNSPIDRLQAQVRHACQILEREIRNPPTVSELARAVRLSVNTLTREFAKTYGIGIPEFVTHQRMKAAHHALTETDRPLKRISYDIGYQHTSNFCAAFKRHFGRTPTEVRRTGMSDLGFSALDRNGGPPQSA